MKFWGLRTCEPQSWGRGGRRGSALLPFERALVSSSYRPSIVTFHLSLPVSEILLLLCCSTSLFPTPPGHLYIPKFSLCSPGSRRMDCGSEGVGLGLIMRAIFFQRFPTYAVLTPDPPTLQTNRQTDEQRDDIAISIPRFALYIVQRPVKNNG